MVIRCRPFAGQLARQGNDYGSGRGTTRQRSTVPARSGVTYDRAGAVGFVSGSFW